MAEVSAKSEIADELRLLRRSSGPLDSAKLTAARIILRGFGGDDPDVALTRLTDLAAEHRGDRDVAAAMASFGWGVAGETSLERLSEFSELHLVDPRTVRRWSDEGIRKLTLLIVGTGVWIQPRIRQTIRQVENELRLGLHVVIPAGLQMDIPRLWVEKEEIEVRLPSIKVRRGPPGAQIRP